MRISVLIATRNRSALIARCLAALAAGDEPPDEILIADQSTDELTRAIAGRSASGIPAPRYLKLDRPGKTRALNAAISASTGDWLALTDDDVEVDRGWIRTLRGLSGRYPECSAFCGRVLPEPGTDPSDYLNLVLDTEPRAITRRTSPLSPGFCGANIVVRREAMLAVGGYDTRYGPGAPFRNNDDGELAYRLVRSGVQVLFVPDLVVFHSGWRRETDNSRLKIEYAFGIGAFVGHYARRGHARPVAYLLRRCVVDLRRVLVGTAARRRDAGLELRGFITGLLRGLGARGRATLDVAEAP